MGVRRFRVRRALLVLLAVSMPAACGSRLPDNVLARIDAGTLGGNGGTAAGTGSGSTTGAGATTGTGTGTTGTGAGTGAATGGGAVGDSGAGGGGGGGAGDAAQADCRGGATDTGVTADEIKVAAMVTASGPLPGATEGQYRGAAAYLAKVNAEGGVCGRKITIIEGDDGLDPQRARGEFLRLEPTVFAFVGSLAVADSGYVDLVGSTGVPYVGVFVDPSGRVHENVVPHADPKVASTGPYTYFKQQYPNVNNVAFLYADIGGVRDNTPAVMEPLKRVGYNIVYNSGAQATSPDYTAEVINMQRASAQMVYLFAFEVNMHVRLARNMRQQNFEPALKVSQIGYNSELIRLLGDTANGWKNPVPHVPMLDEAEPAQNPALQEFLRWNRQLFPDAQVDLFPVNGWGAAALFVKGLRQAGADLTRAGLIQIINGIAEDDGGGMLGTLYPGQRRGTTCFVIERIEAQKWVREYPGSGYECNLGETFRFG
jgi:ABC-type branched-subunit amino acid transport system substrate-binding protein